VRACRNNSPESVDEFFVRQVAFAAGVAGNELVDLKPGLDRALTSLEIVIVVSLTK